MTGKETTEILSKIKLVFEYEELCNGITRIQCQGSEWCTIEQRDALIDILLIRKNQIEEILGI